MNFVPAQNEVDLGGSGAAPPKMFWRCRVGTARKPVPRRHRFSVVDAGLGQRRRPSFYRRRAGTGRLALVRLGPPLARPIVPTRNRLALAASQG